MGWYMQKEACFGRGPFLRQDAGRPSVSGQYCGWTVGRTAATAAAAAERNTVGHRRQTVYSILRL